MGYPRLVANLSASVLLLTPLLAWSAAPPSKPIPLRCSSILTFPDGTTKQNDPIEMLVDEVDGVIRRIDNSLLVSAPDVSISERTIRFSLDSSKVTIDRSTGRFNDEMTVASLNIVVKSSGYCEKFELNQRKF